MLLENIKTIVVLGKCYPANIKYQSHFAKSYSSTGINPRVNSNAIKICKYAVQRDYHQVIRSKLEQICAVLEQNANINCKYFVDSGVVLDKVWGVESGLGWLGNNGLLINDTLGSYFHIGVIFLDIEVASDDRVESGCGNCRLCIDKCPTGALLGGGLLDSRRCLSCYTIERGNKIDVELDSAMVASGCVYGCDICQDVCPYNAGRLLDSEELYCFPADLLSFSEGDFLSYYKDSPILRVGYGRFLRNVGLVVG